MAMFNRTRELDALSTTLKDVPQFSIISGPVNSGKSTLLGKVMKRAKEENDPLIVHIDLHTKTFRDTGSFASAMIEELGSWHKWLKDCVNFKGEIKGKAGVGMPMDPDVGAQLEVTFGISKGKPAMEPSVRLKNTFDILSKALLECVEGIWGTTPSASIDEANRLQSLLEDQKGNAALNDFFAWVVKNTKQDGRFHVMMASSDSFFHRWVTQYVDSAYFRNFVIGHLSKKEAKKFWEEKVIIKHHDKIQPLTFEKAYEVCEGCMHLLSET